MILRQIQVHHYRVLVVRNPVAGESALALLNDAGRFYPRLFDQMMAALEDYTPTYGPPFAETRHGAARAKRLDAGISEFIAQNQEASRRKRAKQSADEKTLGLRIFFFEYGRDVICTNGCYKTTTTPEGALVAAFQVRDAYLAILERGDKPVIEIPGGG